LQSYLTSSLTVDTEKIYHQVKGGSDDALENLRILNAGFELKDLSPKKTSLMRGVTGLSF